MKTKHTQGQWTVNDKNEVEVKNIMGKVLTRFTPFTPKSKIDNSEANAKLIASASELLGALILANKELKSIISILDGRISPEIAKTDLGMRLISFFKANAFICEDKIDPIIKKATK
jgi:hypothetical protein